MRTEVAGEQPVSPMRLLEMLVDRFGAFEAIAYSSIKLARFAPAEELAMDPLVANAILEFGDDLREAASTAMSEQFTISFER
ncbi:MAG: hypothetical protein ACJ8GN_06175 [Longimicrobiaceae bacterium]